jgi:hypothetical protein
MRGASRFILSLVCGLALLTWAASLIAGRTLRGWFERDMQLRAQLAVAGAREPLVANWTNALRLQGTLAELDRRDLRLREGTFTRTVHDGLSRGRWRLAKRSGKTKRLARAGLLARFRSSGRPSPGHSPRQLRG